ncbi:MAG: methyltransferase domain-containing protein [Fibrobacterales bacterium]
MISESAVTERHSAHVDIDELQIDRVNKTLKMMPTEGKLLELGCCFAETLSYYKKVFTGDFYGIDYSKEIVEKRKNDFVEIKQCDLSSDIMPYNDNQFDVVMCGEVIEHIFDTEHMLKEIHRVLKPHGRLIISTPNLSSFLNRIFIIFGMQPLCTEVSSRNSGFGNPFRKNRLPAGHIRNFTARSLSDILTYNKFSIIKKQSTFVSDKPLIKAIEIITGLISHKLGSDLIYQCNAVKD